MSSFAWWPRPPLASLLVLPLFLLLVLARFAAIRSEVPAELVQRDLLRGEDEADGIELAKLPSSGSSDVERSTAPLRSEGKRKLLSLPSPNNEVGVVAFLDGTIYLVNSNSGKVYGSFSSGAPLSTSYQALTDDEIDDSYIYCGDDWNLYEYTKEFGRKKLEISAEEYVNMTPIISDDGGVTLGSNKSTKLFFDVKTGKAFSADWTVQAGGGLESEEEKSLVPKVHSGSPFETSGAELGLLFLVRKDYAIRRYTSSRKLSWSMTVSSIEAHSCLGFNCNLSTKLVVYHIHDINPFSLGLDHPKAFQLPEASIEGDMQPQPPLVQNPLALGMPSNDTQESSISPQSLVDINNNPITTSFAAAIHAFSLAFIYQSTTRSSAEVMPGPFPWYYILVLPMMVFLLYKLVRKSVNPHKQSNDLVKKQLTLNKKRKARKVNNNKNSSVVNKNNLHLSSHSDEAESEDPKGAWGNNKKSLLQLKGEGTSDEGRWIGKLFVSNAEIAKGSNGTVVLEGVYDGRQVAVKRLVRAHHDVASKEIQNLIASDRHPNIVRWFGVEYDSDFVYLSLERCMCSLNDLIQSCSEPSTSDLVSEHPTSNYNIKLSLSNIANKDIELWKTNGCPSSQMIKLMRDVVSGLAHLHELGIVHRDLKPQNVLIDSQKFLSAKLSDMGISKRLPEEMSSLGNHATGHGSIGWQAPEQLLHGRQTRAVDLFSLGCVLFFCITKGKHPFGSFFERDTNILNNRVDLFLVEHIPEAVHLFSNLLNPDPELRPKAVEVLQHPLFWDSETRLSFLRDTSDRVELEDRESDSGLLKAIEGIASVAFGGKWGDKLDAPFITDMGRYRKYKFESTRDLLRVIRNKLNHYRELSKELKEILGSVPEGFDDYFARRFPNLLIEVYKIIYRYCREDDLFRKYFRSTTL